MAEETATPQPEQQPAIDTDQLRSVIREELKAQLEDVPSRDEVDGMIASKLKTVKAETISLIDDRVSPLEAQVAEIKKLLADGVRDLNGNITQLREAVNNHIRGSTAWEQVHSERITSNDKRLDSLADKIGTLQSSSERVNEVVFGGGDGTPGLRAQFATVIGKLDIAADYIAEQKRRDVERQKRREALIEMIKSPILGRILAAGLGLLGALAGVELFGGF